RHHRANRIAARPQRRRLRRAVDVQGRAGAAADLHPADVGAGVVRRERMDQWLLDPLWTSAVQRDRARQPRVPVVIEFLESGRLQVRLTTTSKIDCKRISKCVSDFLY